ncbi:hypothetical protein B0J11DRAFT_589034 [Dendryphion nanum]|uniref:Uncharacterized protein n=1 Tax=Dendryphion nanum TaxID=256645 RepID=A0A9P9EKU6_9PLEO|nr:hypothetical protein B0J11DRAFT_589034 [Dendryphion nanum]
MKLLTVLAVASAALVFCSPVQPADSTGLRGRPSVGASDPIKVELGQNVANAGRLSGPSIYHEVYNALKSICSSNQNNCQTSVYAEIPVAYLDKGQVHNGGGLRLWVTSSLYFGEQERNLLIGIIAAAAQSDVEDKKNCHYSGKLCNVSDYVGVTVGQGYVSMEVRFEQSNKEKHGTFDCIAVKEAISGRVQDLIPEFDSHFGNSYYPDVSCI